MKNHQHHHHLVLLNFITCLLVCGGGQELLEYSSAQLNRSNFPDGFVFGAASSAYQFEGAADVDGRKPSIWDIFTRVEKDKIADGSNGDVADDFYHRYQRDVALVKEIGLDIYRFSISWPRILPGGKISRGVNWKGVNFYNFLINELLANGIQPFVTLFHWDLPQTLEEEYNGFLSPNILSDYVDYVDFCFKEFGDRVKHWATINEPNLFSKYGYATGDYAPGRCSDYIGNCKNGNSATEPYIVVHHMILCHATAVKLYRQKYQAIQKGIIGLIISTEWMVPKYETVASRRAASRGCDFLFGWVLDPITYGEYPETMRNLVGNRLPEFTKAQVEVIKGSYDFIGINYYTASYAADVTSYSNVNLSYTTDSRVNETKEKNGIPIGEATGNNWLYIYPQGLEKLLVYVTRKYKQPVIYITENGMADNGSLPVAEALEDWLRIKYYRVHLSYLLKAIKQGCNVRGYFAWSFLDDFEWASGYTMRFGITYVDYNNQLKRYLKNSALWFKNFLLLHHHHHLPTTDSNISYY